MTSKDVSCAAQKGLQELKNRTLNSGSPVFATQHQNISGVIVSTSSPISSKVPIVPTAYPDPNIQVSDSVYHQNITATSQRVSFPQDYPAEAMTTETIAGIDVDRGADGGTPLKMHLSKSGLLYTLNLIRDPVVDYQEKRGVSRNEEITFVTLVTSLCTQAYTAAITILVMLWNLMPLRPLTTKIAL
ncbi:hypothetical protein GWI33_009213 [Rhynchophorus ferrugineus]|uniref:Uncharacterized protein n=1 Tax=Rhynchophorus ferrugineus TaxID=354439 RepID=A0A834IGX8_RHYFE|nr:hypothetical protein GWI33_009213 [Rhynchophorus ferrugineus]